MLTPKHKCLAHIVAELNATQKAHDILHVVYGSRKNLAIQTEQHRVTICS